MKTRTSIRSARIEAIGIAALSIGLSGCPPTGGPGGTPPPPPPPMPTRTATVSPNRSYQDGKNLVVTITAPEFATVATVVATATLNDGTYSKTWTIIDQKQVMGKSSITVVLKADDPRPNGTGTIQLVTRPAVTVVTIPVEVVDIDPCATVVVPSPVPPVTPPPPPPPSTSP